MRVLLWVGAMLLLALASCDTAAGYVEKAGALLEQRDGPDPKFVPAAPKELGPRITRTNLPKDAPFVGERGTDPHGYPLERPDAVALRNLLRLRRFDLLDQHFAYYQNEFERDFRKEWWPDGAARAFSSSEPVFAAALDEWVSKSPASFAAYAARGCYRVEMGWHFRGGKYAMETSQAQFKTMAEWLEKALADLRKALDLRPRFTAGHTRILLTLNAAGAADETLKAALDEARAQCPFCISVHKAYLHTLLPRWGGSWRKMTDYAAKLQPLLGANPALRLLGGFRSQDECDVLGDKAFKRGGDGEKNWVLIGPAELAAAHRACDEALTFGDEPQFLTEKAELLEREDRFAEALPLLDQALRISPFEREALHDRIFVRGRLGDWLGSARDLLVARRLDPTDEWLAGRLGHTLTNLLRIGKSLTKQKKTREAGEYFTVGLALAPDEKTFIHQVGWNAAKQLEELKNEARRKPDDFDVRLQIDYGLASQGRYSEVVEMWDSFIERHPDDPRAYMERGGARWHLKRARESHADTQKACELGLENACAYLEKKSKFAAARAAAANQ